MKVLILYGSKNSGIARSKVNASYYVRVEEKESDHEFSEDALFYALNAANPDDDEVVLNTVLA